MISAIVAVDNNWGIGFNGDLLEHIPEDLKYFKQLTTGHNVLMGRKTWNSLPVKPLPNRGNYIISSAEPLIMDKNTIRFQMEDALNYLNYTLDDVFIIGGGTIYKELLPYCHKSEKRSREPLRHLVLCRKRQNNPKTWNIGQEGRMVQAPC